MSIYKNLELYKKRRRSFKKSEEYSFCMKNKHILENNFKIIAFTNPNNDFDVMRCNILIYSFLNKQTIENEIFSLETYSKTSAMNEGAFINALKEKIIDLPYLNYGKTKIYIPIFSFALNMVYNKEPEKVLVKPYSYLLKEFKESIVDPFDTYGPLIYDSNFTKLINVSNNGKNYAFFHYDTNTIYIINSQGRLENQIVLFDRYLKRPSYNHMLERIRPVCDAYFNDDKNRFINELRKQKFVSDTFLRKFNYPYDEKY